MGYRGIVPFMSKIRPFIIEVKTNNAGTSSSNQFTIPTTGGGYSYTIRTSNGVTTGNTGNVTITWPIAGTYEIEIYGAFPQIYFNNTGDKLKLLKVKNWGSIEWSSLEKAFRGCSNLDVTATNSPNLGSVNNLSYCFDSCTSLVNSNGSIGIWNTSSVTNMFRLFYFTSLFNKDISSWNTGNVTDMGGMFFASSIFNQPIGSWNTGSVTNMGQMFSNCSFNQNIGSWNTSNVMIMTSMFSGANNFNQNIGGWDTVNVTSMNSMFNGANNFNQNIGGWDTGNVTDMGNMFRGSGHKFNNGGSSSINNWNTSNVTSMVLMFFDQTLHAFNQNIGGWDTGNVTDMGNMFRNAKSFNQNIGAWDVSSVLNFTSMFQSAIAFNNGGSSSINSWVIKTSGPVTMNSMFSSATAFNQPINLWNTSEVTSTFQMFQSSPFNQDISSWNISKATDMRFMFASNSAFNQNLSIWSLRVTGVLLNNIFSGSVMSTANYTDTIVGWANYVQTNSNTPDSVSMANQGGRIFQDSRSGGAGFANAAAARSYLTAAIPTGVGWTISGDTIIP